MKIDGNKKQRRGKKWFKNIWKQLAVLSFLDPHTIIVFLIRCDWYANADYDDDGDDDEEHGTDGDDYDYQIIDQ